MNNSIITVDNLSKKYIIGHQANERYVALRDVITNGVKSAAQKIRHPFGGHDKNDPHFEEFYALKDISFDVKQGDRVGIIGRNGAGKSTLLKVLSRITEPTSGKIKIKGRVASLLEVGTGFHPELTGRENIFLNGAILGMGKAEITKKFDEIVAFAEVEKFLDTPVKRYSSGMYVRLAFAVAAHLEPEILIVDEVLAVGDAQFQKKCLRKMEELSKNKGITILIVSHNMQSIENLCKTAVFLKKGEIQKVDNITDAIKKYSGMEERYELNIKKNIKDRLNRANGNVLFTEFYACNKENFEKWEFSKNEPINFKISFQIIRPVKEMSITIRIRSTLTGEPVTAIVKTISVSNQIQNSTHSFIIEAKNEILLPGIYPLYVWLGSQSDHQPYDILDENVSLPYLVISKGESADRVFNGYFETHSEIREASNVE